MNTIKMPIKSWPLVLWHRIVGCPMQDATFVTQRFPASRQVTHYRMECRCGIVVLYGE